MGNLLAAGHEGHEGHDNNVTGVTDVTDVTVRVTSRGAKVPGFTAANGYTLPFTLGAGATVRTLQETLGAYGAGSKLRYYVRELAPGPGPEPERRDADAVADPVHDEDAPLVAGRTYWVQVEDKSG